MCQWESASDLMSSLVIIDNGSSYTDDLIALLDGLDVSHHRVIPSEFGLATLSRYTGVILSGRKRNDQLMNKINSKIIQHAITKNVKLLGICYGAEIMALTLGGAIRQSNTPQKNVHTTVEVHKDIPIVKKGLINVFESHGYEISRLPDTFDAIGDSTQCKYEIIKYQDKHVYGTQFHPEMSRDGRSMIEQFCQL